MSSLHESKHGYVFIINMLTANYQRSRSGKAVLTKHR